MDKRTRDALPADLLVRAEAYADPVYANYERLGVKDLVQFAASEVERAVRECIEASCAACKTSTPYRVADGGKYLGWEHVKDEWGWCGAEEIHELRYQREHGGK